jgi:hypothetical protein
MRDKLNTVPLGTAEIASRSGVSTVPTARDRVEAYPPLKRRAIVRVPSGTKQKRRRTSEAQAGNSRFLDFARNDKKFGNAEAKKY